MIWVYIASGGVYIIGLRRLRREISSNIRRLSRLLSRQTPPVRLPVRGQRTKTNARTRKGSKRTVGVVRGKEARSAAKQQNNQLLGQDLIMSEEANNEEVKAAEAVSPEAAQELNS